MRKKVYGSGVSREQFDLVRPLLGGVRRRTKPRTVHSYFQKWSEPGPDGISILERALKKSVGEERARQGRNSTTSFLIVDAQSVKNTDTAGQKGYDVGKKVSGIQRHIAVDTRGLPHALAVTTAEVTDRTGALAAFDRCADNLQQITSVAGKTRRHRASRQTQ